MTTPAAFHQLAFADYLSPEHSIAALAASSRLMLALSPWIAARSEPVDPWCLDVYLKFAPLPMRFCQKLDLSGDEVLSPPELRNILSRCPDLQVLKLSSAVTDHHVAVLAANPLRFLRKLDLSESDVTDDGLKIISEKCKALQSLDLSWCSNISDTGICFLSEGCARLKVINLQVSAALIEIDLSNIHLSGAAADLLTSLPQSLERMHPAAGKLSGLSRLSRWVLNLIQNQLSGTADLTKLPPSLQALWLNHNQLTGTPDLTMLPRSLQGLHLQRNQLTGTPDLTMLPQSLQELSLEFNQFSGTPDLTMLPRSLRRLTLQWNQFSGTPDLTKLPKSLQYLALGKNRFAGELDTSGVPEGCIIIDS